MILCVCRSLITQPPAPLTSVILAASLLLLFSLTLCKVALHDVWQVITASDSIEAIRRPRGINPPETFLIGVGMLVSAFILLVPMILHLRAGVQQRVNAGTAKSGRSDMLHAIWLTVLIALIAVPVNLVFKHSAGVLSVRALSPDVSYC